MKRRLVVAVVAAAVVLAGGAVALASIPDAQGVIHACRNTKDGSLRVIDADAGQTCGKDEAALNWNQTGPQGPAGEPGLGGVHVVIHDEPWDGGFAQNDVTVNCPPGETALSATAAVVAPGPNPPEGTFATNALDGYQALPVETDGRPTGYHMQGRSLSSQQTVRFAVTCAVTS
jgi:hypothetical protein